MSEEKLFDAEMTDRESASRSNNRSAVRTVCLILVLLNSLAVLARCMESEPLSGGEGLWAVLSGLVAFFVVVDLCDRFGGDDEKPVFDFYGLARRAGLLNDKGIPLGIIVRPGREKTRDAIALRYNGDRGICTFGPIGSGKNVSVQTPALLTYLASIIVLDVKGQLYSIAARARRAMGHRVSALNPFGLLGIPSARYNPLRNVNKNSLSFVTDCRRICEDLVDQPEHKTDQSHFSLSALNYSNLMTMFTVHCGGDTMFPKQRDGSPAPRDMSLIRVRELVNLPDAQRMALCDGLRTYPYPPIAEIAAHFGSSSKDSKEVRDSISTAKTQLMVLADPGIERMLRSGPNEIRFIDTKRGKHSIFLMIEPDKLATHGKVMRLLASAVITEFINDHGPKPERPVLLMLDEFLQLGKTSLATAALVMRDYQLQIWIILQNYPALLATYGREVAESFLSSFGVVQAFTQSEVTTAEMLSRMSGIKRVKEYSFSQSSSSGQGGGSSGSSLSYHWVEKPTWAPHQIMQLNQQDQLLFMPGLSEPVLGYRLPYMNRPDLQGLYDQDPYHV